MEDTLCSVCGLGNNEATLLICDGCDETATHAHCAGLLEMPDEDENWFCGSCEDTVCSVCGLGNNEDTLLICDGCANAAHAECIGLATLPASNWFCGSCDTVCSVCDLGNNADTLLLCDGCDFAAHARCIGISTMPAEDEDWHCGSCAGGAGRRTRAPDWSKSEDEQLLQFRKEYEQLGAEGRPAFNKWMDKKIPRRSGPGAVSRYYHLFTLPETKGAAVAAAASASPVFPAPTPSPRWNDNAESPSNVDDHIMSSFERELGAMLCDSDGDDDGEADDGAAAARRLASAAPAKSLRGKKRAPVAMPAEADSDGEGEPAHENYDALGGGGAGDSDTESWDAFSAVLGEFARLKKSYASAEKRRKLNRATDEAVAECAELADRWVGSMASAKQGDVDKLRAGADEAVRHVRADVAEMDAVAKEMAKLRAAHAAAMKKFEKEEATLAATAAGRGGDTFAGLKAKMAAGCRDEAGRLFADFKGKLKGLDQAGRNAAQISAAISAAFAEY